MRLALVVERFEPAAGGVEQVVWKVAHALAEAGDEVHVLAARAAPSPAVRLHPLPVPRFWQPLRVLAFSRAARREISRCHFELVHSFSRTLQQDIFHAGGGCHADYMHDTYGPWGARARRLSPRHALLLSLERRIFSDPDQVIQCVSGGVRDAIAARFAVDPRRLVLIRNGVDVERFRAEPSRTERLRVREQYGAGDATVWLLVGSGWRRKGLDTALRALAACRDPRAQLWVAGSDAPTAWQRLAAHLGVGPRVRFLGAQPKIERIYAAADGLLLPTRYDAFGLVCLEAAACALPVVTSANAGASEILGGAAVIVKEPEDVQGFARALSELADPTARALLGSQGRQIAESHDWPTQVKALRALYQRNRR